MFNVFDLGNRIKKTHFLLKMNIYLLRVTTLLLWVNSLALFAQQTDIDSLTVQTTNLEEVVISDSRFPLKRSQSGKPIVKINADEISKFQGLGLSELVRQYAGIEIIGSQSYAWIGCMCRIRTTIRINHGFTVSVISNNQTGVTLLEGGI